MSKTSSQTSAFQNNATFNRPKITQPKVKILVATHKSYPMPASDLYLPIQVGRERATKILPFIGDNTGEHISAKNPTFCELTALYWAWKNLDADYIGLAHYRRHFKTGQYQSSITQTSTTSSEDDIIEPSKLSHTLSQLEKVVTMEEVSHLLKTTDVILPTKRHYYLMNLYDHYCHTMNPAPLEQTREIIAHQCPAYLAEFDRLKTRRSAHMFNMCIMQRDLFAQYCTWLFDILFALEKQVDTADWSDFERRYAGRISERLLDVWLNTNHISYRELPVVNLEPVNWLKKGTGFLQAKFFRRQYEKSW